MAKYILTYFITLATFVAIDLVWLMWIARSTYVAEMGTMLRKEPQLVAAFIFYFLYAAGLMYFAVAPALKLDSVTQGLMLGAVLGLVAYGTYDLTALSVINGFNTKIAVIDLIWGAALSGTSAAIAVAIARKFWSWS
jgi:uncharacterized membrane protein